MHRSKRSSSRANIPVPAAAVPQIATVKNPQIATPQTAGPQIATFALAPFGGIVGQNAGDPGVADLRRDQ